METETLDKLYLEWSQFTKAKTAKEAELEAENARLRGAIKFHRDHHQIYGSDRANKDLYSALDPQEG